LSDTNTSVMAVEGSGGDAPGQDLPNFDIGAIVAKHAAALITSAEPTPAAETQAAAPATPPPPAAVEPAKVEPPPAEELPAAKRLAALARHQAEVEAQKAVLATEKEGLTKQVAAEVEKAKAELRDAFLRNPLKFVRDTGVPRERLGKVATLLLGEEMGEDADPNTRIQLKQLELEMELEGIKQKQSKPEPETEKAPPVEFQIRREMADKSIADFTGEVPVSEYPFLAAEAKEDRAGVYRALCSIYIPHMNAGTWPSVQTVARQLETQLRSEYERLDRVVKGQPQTASSTQPPPSVQREAPNGSVPSSCQGAREGSDGRGVPPACDRQGQLTGRPDPH
jgi:hypothetical protein